MDGIVVTGIGLITPQACGREASWDAVRAGRRVTDVAPSMALSPTFRSLARPSPFVNPNGLPQAFHLALAAAREALDHAGFKNVDPARLGNAVSVSKPVLNFSGIGTPPLWPPDAVNVFLSRNLKAEGPAMNVVAACATGAHSILLASRWIQEGLCDAALAGSVESSLNPLYMAGFSRLGVLSSDPRPFDLRRCGFVMGEGAGVMLLERESYARARGVSMLARFLGGALGADTHHPASFKEDGSTVAPVLARAMASARMSPSDVGYVNAHGTGTVSNDRIETLALRRAFGRGADALSVSSTKGSTGHLLGASAGVEAALTCLALRDGIVPPTSGLEQSDPACDLDFTPGSARHKKIGAALSISLGFGGPIGVLAFAS